MLGVWKENIGLQRVKAVNTLNIKGRIWNRSLSQSSRVAKQFFFPDKHRMKRKERKLQALGRNDSLVVTSFYTTWSCYILVLSISGLINTYFHKNYPNCYFDLLIFMENMEITNYFETTSKKREFLNRGSSSSNDDVSKRVKENENPSSSSGNVTDGNVGSTETVNTLVVCSRYRSK